MDDNIAWCSICKQPDAQSQNLRRAHESCLATLLREKAEAEADAEDSARYVVLHDKAQSEIATLTTTLAAVREAAVKIEGALRYAPPRLCVLAVTSGGCDCLPPCRVREENYRKAMVLLLDVHRALTPADVGAKEEKT